MIFRRVTTPRITLQHATTRHCTPQHDTTTDFRRLTSPRSTPHHSTSQHDTTDLFRRCASQHATTPHGTAPHNTTQHNTMNILLSATQEAELLRDATAQLAERLTDIYAADLAMVSLEEAARILGVHKQTMPRLAIRKVIIVPKSVIRYRLSDLKNFVTNNIEK